MAYHDENYKINPKIAEMILKQKAKMGMEYNIGISNIEAENIIIHWINSDDIDKRKYDKLDKQKLLFNIYDINPNNHKTEQINRICNNINNVFDKNEIVEFVHKMADTYYKPGIVYGGHRSNNDGIINLIKQFNFIKLYNGVIINKTFIGDMKKIFPDIQFDEKTGIITDKDVDDKMMIFINFIKQEFKNIKYTLFDDVCIIATDDNGIFEQFNSKFEGLKVELVPDFYFKWL